MSLFIPKLKLTSGFSNLVYTIGRETMAHFNALLLNEWGGSMDWKRETKLKDKEGSVADE